MKKFRDMTDSEKLEIINAMIEGDPVEGFYADDGKWVVLAVARGVNFDTSYRIPKRPMSIDWSALKDEFICAARGPSGQCAAFSEKPKSCGYGWLHLGIAVDIDHLKSLEPGTVDWTESLIWRPGFEPK